MKKYFFLIAILFGWMMSIQATDITFQVHYEEAVPNGMWLWIDNTGYWGEMTDDDMDNTYTVTVAGLAAGTQVWYSYWIGEGDNDTEIVPPESSFYDNNYRFLMVPDGNETIPVVDFGGNPDPLPTKVDVTFSVELAGDSVMTNGMWMVSKGPWHWEEQMNTTGDVYAKTWQLFAGQTLPYTFVYGGQDNWDGEESVPEECNYGTSSAPERKFDGTMNDSVMPVIPFGECISEANIVSVTYQVNMNEIDMVDGDIVWVYMNGDWPVMTDENADGIYEAVLNQEPGTEVWYYFAYGTDAEYDEEVVPAECSNADGYRVFTVENEDMVLMPYFYGTCDIVGLEEINSDFRIYPNPAQDFIQIDFVNVANDAEIQLVDVSGAVIMQTKLNGLQNTSISTQYLSNGIYFVHIISSTVNTCEKVMINK